MAGFGQREETGDVLEGGQKTKGHEELQMNVSPSLDLVFLKRRVIPHH